MRTRIIFTFVLLFPLINLAQNTMNYNKLTPEEQNVILNKDTELPWTGEHLNNKGKGQYTCKQCDAPLYNSEDKFDSHCGWPCFDDEIDGAVVRLPDPDGIRTEILCANCSGHLGHVFIDEGFTNKETRHCVNSISMNFIPAAQLKESKTERAIFAGGCFWGVEYFMEQKEGVISVVSGYIGGNKDNPTYREVCSGTTGHAEAVEIVFDPSKVTFEELTRLFFEIHDPTHINHQGPDMGEQYRSEIFYINEDQKKIVENLISLLKSKGYKVATKVTKATTFWPAEDYHQDYYEHKGTLPYCHGYTKRF